MEFNSKKYFEDFLDNNLRLDNAEKIYDMFWKLETDEEILFKNCCKILGIDRDELLYKFDMSVCFLCPACKEYRHPKSHKAKEKEGAFLTQTSQCSS